MVPDDSLTIRERAVAAWPTAWHGQNLRDILVDARLRRRPSLARSAEEGSRLDPVHRRAADRPGLRRLHLAEVRQALKRKEEPSYQGTFTSARRYVLHTFANTQSPLMKKRVSQYMLSSECPLCHGKRLRRESLSVKFAGFDIADMSALPLTRLAGILRPFAEATAGGTAEAARQSIRRRRSWSQRIAAGSRRRASPSCSTSGSAISRSSAARPRFRPANSSGCGWPRRSAPTCSASSTCSTSHRRACIRPTPRRCLRRFDRLKASGNSLFVVEHDLDVIRHADWIVDVGPAAGEQGGHVLYSGPPEGLERVEQSQTRRYLFGTHELPPADAAPAAGLAATDGVTRNNLDQLDVGFPLGVFTTVTGVSGSGKSSLVSQALVELVAEQLGHDTHCRR